jgi:hypothetical protein
MPVIPRGPGGADGRSAKLVGIALPIARFGECDGVGRGLSTNHLQGGRIWFPSLQKEEHGRSSLNDHVRDNDKTQ